jgi:hypothetical protein
MKQKAAKAAPAKVTTRSDTRVPSKGKAPVPRVTLTKASEPAREHGKEKRIRGEFSMPERDYALIADLKSRSKKNGRTVKKNELLRAGLQALNGMKDDALQSVLAALTASAEKSLKKAK